MNGPPHQNPGIGGTDPLDASFGHTQRGPDVAHRAWKFEQRLALGLSPTPGFGLFVLLLGVALGSDGLNLLSPTVLSYFDPAVAVALAALGVLVGLGFDIRRPRQGRLLAAASLEAGLTMLLVGAGMLLILSLWSTPMDLAPWLFALLLGLCASASATTATDTSDESRGSAAYIGDLDDVLPIVIGGLALAWMRESGTPWAAVWLTVQAGGVALVIALAAWLLVTQAASDDEQHVFALGGLLLLGGAAEYLSLSALLAGFVAGVFWNLAGGPARDRIRRDVYYVQHPLVFLLLVIAGARVGFTSILFGLAVGYLVLRITGKVAGGWLVRRLIAPELPAQVGLRLMSPGIVGIAFALNVLQAGGSEGVAVVLAVAAAGSLGSELLSLLVRPFERPA